MTNDLVKSWGSGIDASKLGRELEEQRQRAAAAQARKDRVARANKDADFFCQYYLPHYFPSPLAAWQHEVLEETDGNPRIAQAFAAPRGHGKTTFVSFALTLRDLLRGVSKFTVYIGPTKEAGEARISEILQELENNERLMEDYGDMLKSSNGTPLKRASNNLELANGSRIVSRGCGQSMRGVKSREHRPDRVVVDDVDDDKEAVNPKRVEKKWKWFKSVVLGLSGAAGMAVIVIGNIIARVTFLTNALSSKNFNSHIYRAIQDDGTPLMPLLWPLERLEAKRQEVGTDVFEIEFQNNPPSETTRPFREAWLQRRWTHDQLSFVPRRIVVAVDFSRGKTERSDYQAMIAIIRDDAGVNYIVKADLGRRTRKGFIRRLFDFCTSLGLEFLLSVVLETNGFQEWAKQEIDELSAALGLDLPIIEQENTLNKYERILRLSPIAEGSRLLWPPEEDEDESVKLLRSQFEMFPDDKHDDGPDATEMAVRDAAARQRGSDARVASTGPFDRFNMNRWRRN